MPRQKKPDIYNLEEKAKAFQEDLFNMIKEHLPAGTYMVETQNAFDNLLRTFMEHQGRIAKRLDAAGEIEAV